MSKAIVAGVDDELDRVARSCAALRAVHRADHYIEPDRSAPFELRVSVHTLGALRLMEIAGSPQSTRIGHGGEDVVLAIVVHAGHGRIRQGAREAVLGPGVLCLLHGGEAFELILNEGFRHQVVRVPRERMTESFPAWPVLLMCTIPTGRGPAAMLAAHLRATQEHLESLTPADQKGVSEALLCLLVSTLSASLPAPSERLSRIERYHLERVKAYVRAHLADPELNVATISAAMGLSVRYLHGTLPASPVRRRVLAPDAVGGGSTAGSLPPRTVLARKPQTGGLRDRVPLGLQQSGAFQPHLPRPLRRQSDRSARPPARTGRRRRLPLRDYLYGWCKHQCTFTQKPVAGRVLDSYQKCNKTVSAARCGSRQAVRMKAAFQGKHLFVPNRHGHVN